MKRSIKEEFRAKEESCLTIDGHLGSIRMLTAVSGNLEMHGGQTPPHFQANSSPSREIP